MIVVSDTSPICYLILIGQVNLLERLYGTVVIPQIVANELSATGSPSVVQSWIAQPPDWLDIQPVELSQDTGFAQLDPGERCAILLAERIGAGLVILDDKPARKIAIERGLGIIGLLGILKDAADASLLDLEATFDQLQNVGFWVAPELLQRLLIND